MIDQLRGRVNKYIRENTGYHYKGMRVYKAILDEYAYAVDGEFLVKLSEEEFKKVKEEES